jgi:hypothetical protein
MNHPSAGELHAYRDGALVAVESDRVRVHLAACEACRREAAVAEARAQHLRRRLGALAPAGPGEAPVPASAARARLLGRARRADEVAAAGPRLALAGLFHRHRPLWAGTTAALALAAALALPPVRAVAGGILGLFRVQRIAVVEVNPGDLPETLGSSSQFEQMVSEDVKVEEHGEVERVVSAAEASARAGFPVRLPAAAPGPPALTVQPSARVSFTVDLPRVRALLEAMGRADIRLPEEADGLMVAADIPRSVRAVWGGDCEPKEAEGKKGERGPDRDCTFLLQVPSPTVSVLPAVDIDPLAQAFLQIVGMSGEEAARFSRTVDWSTTLVVPIPRYNTTYSEVQVDGVTGTLIRERGGEHGRPGFMLLWVRDGVVHALAGPGDESAALALANSMR